MLSIITKTGIYTDISYRTMQISPLILISLLCCSSFAIKEPSEQEAFEQRCRDLLPRLTHGDAGQNPHLNPYAKALTGMNPQLEFNMLKFMKAHKDLEPSFPLLFGRTSLQLPITREEILNWPKDREKPSHYEIEGTTDLFLINTKIDDFSVYLALHFKENGSCTIRFRDGYDDGQGRAGRGLDAQFMDRSIRQGDPRFVLFRQKFPQTQLHGNPHWINEMRVEFTSDKEVKEFLSFFSEHMH